LRKITHELSFEEQLTVASPDGGGAQDSSAISDNAAGKNGKPGDVGGGNENQGSGTNGNRESSGQQNQNNTEPGGSYAVTFLDWSQYGAPGWTETCPGVDLSDLIGGWSGSKVVELLELQTLYLIGREERTLYY